MNNTEKPNGKFRRTKSSSILPQIPGGVNKQFTLRQLYPAAPEGEYEDGQLFERLPH
ncbi:MAG: hypothetical protein HYY87_04045 [Candidatus Levybacteria bacterium]|nr:hypothetical protein [Candidatus Levybacteria bacterium]